eukprot:3979604-Pyramimonas_sp.AAC.1
MVHVPPAIGQLPCWRGCYIEPLAVADRISTLTRSSSHVRRLGQRAARAGCIIHAGKAAKLA